VRKSANTVDRACRVNAKAGVNRRRFLTWSLGGGLALGLPAAGVSFAQSADPKINPWITLHPDGHVTLVSTALEMGQGARTGQAQVLADELDVPWAAISVVTAPDQAPFQLGGELYSGGSQTVRTRYDMLRLAGATVRAQLTQAAANRWRAPLAECHAALGQVTHEPTGRRLSYGALASDAAAIRPLEKPPLKPADQRRHVGRSLSTIGQANKIDGSARYGIDFRLPGLVFASLRQCPTFGGHLDRVDEAPARALKGVRKVVRLSDAVAVIADTTYAAFRGVRALNPDWKEPAEALDMAAISRRLAAAAGGEDAIISPRQGGKESRTRLRAAISAAARKHEATYEIAYLAHAPLEPMNATAWVRPDRVEIWAPTQAPTAVRKAVAEALGRPLEQVSVTPLLMGGGFGRRLQTDYAVQAALVAAQWDSPVQLVWTREEDFAHDFYRPAMTMTLRAALPSTGPLTGYEVIAATADDLTGGSGPAPYRVADYAATLSNVRCGVPTGSWRAVDPGMSLFAKESFLDECALLSGADPLAYRRALLGDNTRALRVLAAAAEAIGWATPRAAGVGRGIAILAEWDTIVANAIEVEVIGRRLRVRRLVAAVDCGLAINPQQVRAQAEGGGLMALSAALGERVTVTAGKVDQSNFHQYPVLRMAQAPRVDIVILETPAAAVGGMGEPPVPAVAPALANAIFQACGRRVRRLPIVPEGFELVSSTGPDGNLVGSP
jgi:isoquinoline 1-oxidoreductase beta subunit